MIKALISKFLEKFYKPVCRVEVKPAEVVYEPTLEERLANKSLKDLLVEVLAMGDDEIDQIFKNPVSKHLLITVYTDNVEKLLYEAVNPTKNSLMLVGVSLHKYFDPNINAPSLTVHRLFKVLDNSKVQSRYLNHDVRTVVKELILFNQKSKKASDHVRTDNSGGTV